MRDQPAKDAYRLIRTTAEVARKGTSLAQSAAKAPDSAALLEDVAHWLDDAKAEDIVSIPLKGKSALGDFMVVASGRNDRHVAAIAESAQEQSSGLQQINTAVNQMDQDTQKNAAMVEESTAASHGLAREASSLNQQLAQFKLSDGGYSEASAPVRAASPIDRPAASPARALGGRIRAAFSGNAALNTSADSWEEF